MMIERKEYSNQYKGQGLATNATNAQYKLEKMLVILVLGVREEFVLQCVSDNKSIVVRLCFYVYAFFSAALISTMFYDEENVCIWFYNMKTLLTS